MTMINATRRKIRIGGASAGYGDGLLAAPRLILDGDLDFIMFDFLSEFYMPMAGRMRRQDSAKGFVLEFPDAFAAIVVDMLKRGIKLITNAGAVNPHACAAALVEAAARVGASPKIAVVDGDDLVGRAGDLRRAGRLKGDLPRNGYTGINAYVGAFPIARALSLGADVVVTGRVVDSALALGPLVYAFGWSPEDYDRLAAGSLIGHLLECGAQASGGLFTDWREIADYADIGYPIAECYADGSCVITKPAGTGGLVSVGTVAEQLLYEIADPRDYRLPDVAVNFADVSLTQVGADQVRVTGAKGRSPGPDYKAIATWDEGWIASYGFVMRGPDAADKARAIANSVLKRSATMLRERNMAELRRSRVDVFGNEETFGAQARGRNSREVFCRVAVEHEDPRGIGLLMREHGTASVSMAPGIAGSGLFMPPQPMARSEAFFVPAAEVPVTVTLGEHTEIMARTLAAPEATLGAAPEPPVPPEQPDAMASVAELAWVRSGDKGDVCNVGIIARRDEYLPYIAAFLDEERIRLHYAHMFNDGKGQVRRYYLPGTAALNFLLQGALDGGCTVSLSYDPFGKSAAQEVLDILIPIPRSLLAH